MRYWVLLWLCAASVIAYLQRAALSVPASIIRRELELDEQLMGFVMGGWFFGYALMQVPAAWVADRLGSRNTLAFCVLAWSLLTALTGQAQDFWSLFFLWMLMGVAQAGLVPCAAKAIGGWFGESVRAFASSWFMAGMLFGGLVAPVLTGQLLKEGVVWQHIVVAYAVPGIIWALAFPFVTPRYAGPVNLPLQRQTPPPVDWGRLAASPTMHLLCAQQFLRAGAVVFFLTWFPTYLQATRGVTTEESGTLTMFAGIGQTTGALTAGILSDLMLRWTGHKRLSRQGLAVGGLVICVVLSVTSAFVEDTFLAITLISVGIFFATFSSVSVYPVALEYSGPQVATVFSTLNMCGNFGAFLFPIAVGWFVKTTGTWEPVLFFFAGIFAAAAVLWAMLNPRGTYSDEEPVPGIQLPPAVSSTAIMASNPTPPSEGIKGEGTGIRP